MSKKINTELLRRSITSKMKDENLIGATAAAQIGIGESTLNRMINNVGLPHPSNLLRVCRWLNVPFEQFTHDRGRVVLQKNADTIDRIEQLIMSDASLADDDRLKLVEIFRAQYKTIVELTKK